MINVVPITDPYISSQYSEKQGSLEGLIQDTRASLERYRASPGATENGIKWREHTIQRMEDFIRAAQLEIAQWKSLAEERKEALELQTIYFHAYKEEGIEARAIIQEKLEQCSFQVWEDVCPIHISPSTWSILMP